LIARASQHAIAPVEEIMKRLGLGTIVAISLTLPAFGQQAVNPEGVYQLNLAKSTIRGAPYSKSETLNYTADGFTVAGFDSNGKSYTAAVTVIGDGKARPLNSVDYDAITFTQLDPYTLSLNRTKAGKVVETGIRIVNPDGKSVWVTRIGTTATGQSYSYVLVYEKQ
jgi:hypothetical protein